MTGVAPTCGTLGVRAAEGGEAPGDVRSPQSSDSGGGAGAERAPGQGGPCPSPGYLDGIAEPQNDLFDGRVPPRLCIFSYDQTLTGQD